MQLMNICWNLKKISVMHNMQIILRVTKIKIETFSLDLNYATNGRVVSRDLLVHKEFVRISNQSVLSEGSRRLTRDSDWSYWNKGLRALPINITHSTLAIATHDQLYFAFLTSSKIQTLLTWWLSHPCINFIWGGMDFSKIAQWWYYPWCNVQHQTLRHFWKLQMYCQLLGQPSPFQYN